MIITSLHDNATPLCNAVATKIFILQYRAMRRNFIIVNEDILAKTISYSVFRFYLFLLQVIFRCLYMLKQIVYMIYYNILFFTLQTESSFISAHLQIFCRPARPVVCPTWHGKKLLSIPSWVNCYADWLYSWQKLKSFDPTWKSSYSLFFLLSRIAPHYSALLGEIRDRIRAELDDCMYMCFPSKIFRVYVISRIDH